MASLDEYFEGFARELQAIRREVADIKQTLQGDKLSYSLTEAAQATGLSRETLWDRCKSGFIRYGQDRPGGTITISREELERFIAARAAGQLERIQEIEAPVIKLHSKSKAGKVLRRYTVMNE